MKSMLIGALLGVALSAALPAAAALSVGESAPDFTAPASLAGKTFEFSLRDSLKKGPVVVYFYPGAFTRGCNLQAHTFAENQAKFAAAGATVIGVSLDRIERLNEFSADPEYCGGKVAVASDPDGRIAKSYQLAVKDARPGAKDTRGNELDHGFAERSTFVVQDGHVRATISGVAPDANVEQALAVVQKLARP
jgi:peroxiredoxin